MQRCLSVIIGEETSFRLPEIACSLNSEQEEEDFGAVCFTLCVNAGCHFFGKPDN